MSMAEWTPIENSISLEALLKRWKGIEIAGEKFDFQTIDNFVRGCQITAYDRKDWVIVNGHKEWRGQKRAPVLGLNGSDPFNPGVDIIFDQQEIGDIERRMFPSGERPGQGTAEGSTAGKTDWRDCNVILDIESQPSISASLCRNNLVLAHDADGTICPPKLAAFPLKIFFTEMPRPDEGDFYSSHDLMERYELGPAEFVEYLMSHKDLFPHGVQDWFYIQHRVIVIDESGIGYEYQPMSRKVEELDNLAFHYRTIRNHERMMQENGYYDRYYDEWPTKPIQNEDNEDGAPSRLAELEAQLAETQKQIESFRQWNKRLNEQNQELRAELAAAKEKIAELEKERAAAKQNNSAEAEQPLTRWDASIESAFKTIIDVCKSGRVDWVSGLDGTTGDRDSAGDETFRALLTRQHTGNIPVLAQVERAAWSALSKGGYAWTGGRKPLKRK